MRRCTILWALPLFAALLVVTLAAAPAQATDYTFNNWTGIESYNEALNWNPRGVLGAGDKAIFDDTALVHPLDGPIAVDDATETGELVVQKNSDVDFSVSGTFSLLDPVYSLRVGHAPGDDATMYLSQGELVSTNAAIGYGADSRGKLTIRNGASWRPEDVYVGFWSSSSDGSLDVLGSLTTGDVHGDLIVGFEGVGNLNVNGGAQLDSDHGNVTRGDAIGYAATAVGVATVEDAGSQWTTDKLSVGNFGTGTLWVKHGGKVDSTEATIQDVSGTGLVVVTGPDSLWDIDSTLKIGGSPGGSGTLRIQNDAKVELADQTTLYATGSILVAGGTFSTGQLVKADTAGTFTWTSGTVELSEQMLVLDSDVPDSVFGHDLTVGRGKALKVSWANPNQSLHVGSTGYGQITIEDGGSVESYQGFVGDSFGTDSGHGTVTVNGAGSTASARPNWAA